MPDSAPHPASISRRRLLGFAAAGPLGAVIAACGGSSTPKPDSAPASKSDDPSIIVQPAAKADPPVATPTPQPPFIIPAGEQKRMLMPGTPYETPMYVYGSGVAGQILMVLGGVHGNEPGGWQAAEKLQASFRPARGAFIVVPRANKVPIQYFERTLPELGDLNRLYPGDPNGLPMARMAAQIVDAAREFHVNALLDMHESWAFYKDRPQNGTAFLGQTVATAPEEPALSLVHQVVEAVNTRIQAPREEFFDRAFPGPQNGAGLPGPTPAGGGSMTSSLSLPRFIPGIIAILVEMGQQQPLERRVALHIDVFMELARRLGVADA